MSIQINAVDGGRVKIGIAIGIGIEMVLGHEQSDVYRLSIGYVFYAAIGFSRAVLPMTLILEFFPPTKLEKNRQFKLGI